MSKVSKSKRAECLTQNLILKTGQKIVCHVSIKKEYNHLLNLRLHQLELLVAVKKGK